MLTQYESDVVSMLPMRACCWGSSARFHRLLPATIGLGELALVSVTGDRPRKRF